MQWRTGPLSVLVMLALATALPAEARETAGSKKAPKAKMATTHVASRQIESHDCVRANGVDPAGNYKGFPCWARAAFGPESGQGRR